MDDVDKREGDQLHRGSKKKNEEEHSVFILGFIRGIQVSLSVFGGSGLEQSLFFNLLQLFSFAPSGG